MIGQRDIEQFLRDDAGSPLGVGMPSGRPLRADGESHYEAWQTLLRADPCAYCAGPGGTVDHVEPRARPVRGLGTAHGWANLVGACVRCNGAKRDLDLLAFLHRRPQIARRRRAIGAWGAARRGSRGPRGRSQTVGVR